MLEVRDLAKRYGHVVALDGTSFAARPGRLVGFLGPNGAGKTTTMRCIFGLVVPDRGEATWRGSPIEQRTRLKFGYMPEQRGLYPRMKVGEQVAYFAMHHGLSSRDARAAAARWLDRLGLADRMDAKLEELSHGNQQRVQLAVALAHEPELLVLDEPFSGLDPIGTATMTEVLRERAASGVGILFSSHQLDLVEDICEDVVIIANGRIVAQGEIDELKRAAHRRHLEIEVEGGDGSWLDGLGDAQVLEQRGNRYRLLVDDTIDVRGVVERAAGTGPIRRFVFEPPRLSALFMDAIQQDGREAGDGSRPVDARREVGR